MNSKFSLGGMRRVIAASVLSLCASVIVAEKSATVDIDLKAEYKTPYGRSYFNSRADGRWNSPQKFAKDKRGRVAFLGGSITHNSGWRDMTADYLREKFPETDFEFINAGIPSMGSTPGAFRLERDVLSHGLIDLLFVEAAVNDSTNGRSPDEISRAMEGIVRHVRRVNRRADIIMMHFVDPEKMKFYNAGGEPEVIRLHEKVAEHYHVSSLNLALEVTERIWAGEFDWKNDFKNLHPSPFGQKVYARSIRRLLDVVWAKTAQEAAGTKDHYFPSKPLDPYCYDRGRLVRIEQVQISPGWRIEPRWRPEKGGTRAGFVDEPMLIIEAPGPVARYEFQGRAVGVFVAAGYDAGVLEFRIDGGNWEKRDLFTQWSRGLHLPWAHVLVAELDGEKHLLEIRSSEEKNPQSAGHAVRIRHILLNR